MLGEGLEDWASITHQLLNRPRQAAVRRSTNETDIRVFVDLDAPGGSEVSTGIGFFDHMLEQLSRHSLIDMDIEAKGDLHIDDHHTVEDIGITLGQAVAQAVGDKKGIVRYGHAYVPLDEALSRVVVDFSGRPGLVYAFRRIFSAAISQCLSFKVVGKGKYRYWRRAAPCIAEYAIGRAAAILC